ncbi:RnfABCDGE type electron transport complex subunit B [Mesosutterella sp. OilRF-GAM-744-9]|uniref:RnfABCDGE type electron transport complex subunit B n=1 Tax=Mesosutterella porci TaxID=2915351 RepID=A0ABS9MPF6_9BURK|nr:RnfABCDGE type electron transport complex subunit B [Mesosutterella sp. oilRF-744-WT-GAM-9]MCG5030493.1 RnfABCDGE type electron transport complex subunit B [Mesosutterella sp. oilRF-744-WT-GAM-9]
MAQPELLEALEDALPQTQCRQCGFEGCAAYARAMAEGRAPLNRCASGGEAGIRQLARILGTKPLPLDPEYGREMPFAIARIRASECIGCGRCLRVCPVDAVIGGQKRLHAVIEGVCTGCALCQSACPLACIDMVEAGRVWSREDARLARRRHEQKLSRLEGERARAAELYRSLGEGDENRRKEAILALLGLAPKKN